MKSIAILILFLLTAGACLAQTGSVTGKVTESGGKPLEAATVTLYKLPDSALVTGTKTGPDGIYLFSAVAPGIYYLEARLIGLNCRKSKAFSLDRVAVEIPAITLVLQAKQLKEVSVTGQRPFIERQADKIVVNVENSLVSTGSTALEVLQRTPGITIDKDDHLQLKGKSGVTVMLDGKLTYMSADQISNLLKNMASENISKIEVITNPSAKYDAAGNTGIVNIITKKGRKSGLNGNFTASLSKGINFAHNTGLNLNYKTSRFNFFGDLDFSERRNLFRRDNYSLYSIDPLVSTDLTSRDQNHGRHFQYKGGVDIMLSGNQSLSLTVNGYEGLFQKIASGSSYNINRRPLKADTTYITQNSLRVPYSNITYTLGYKAKLDTLGSELTVDADYARFTQNSEISQSNVPFTGIPFVQNGNIITLNNHQPAIIDIRTLRSDYTHPVDSMLKVEAGAKASWVQTHNDFRYDSLANGSPARPQRANNFIYTERILAAYLSSTFKWKLLTLQAGLRFENTRSVGDLVSTSSSTVRNYTDLFPNLSLTQKLSENHQLAFSLSRRINRPDYDNLNPFVFYLDKNSYFTGNPNLKPQYTFQYELSYTFRQKYIATLNYSSTRDYINEFASFDPVRQVTRYTNANFDHQNSYNATFSAPGDFTPWWTSTNNLSLNYNKFSNQLILNGAKQGSASYNINIVETFKIPGKWKAELNGFYNSRDFDGTYRFQAQTAIGAGIQKTFLNKHADLKFSGNDLFNTSHFFGNAFYNNVNIRVRNKWESRRFTLAFTYRFGGAGTEESRKKSAGQDERSRAGGKG